LKILIASHRYFLASGPERYFFNVSDQLEAAGHAVVPFSVRYDGNRPTPYEKYFVSPIGGRSQTYLSEYGGSARGVIKSFQRLFYSPEVERDVMRLAREVKPDVAYVLYFLRKLSPSLLVGLKRSGVPIVARLSDYGLFCSEHHCFRDEQPCTKCIGGNFFHAAIHGCVKGSRALSLASAAALTFQHWRGYFDLIDHFVVTNDFMRATMIEAGFPPARMTTVPTFADLDAFSPAPRADADRYMLWLARLDRPKGFHVLLDALRLLKDRGAALPPLRVAGSGHVGAYVDAMRAKTHALKLDDSVQFLGNVAGDAVPGLLRGAAFMISPALWFENLPNTVVEALACGTPVIASDIGSLACTLTHEVDSLLFPPGDAAALADAIVRLLGDAALRARLATGARATAERNHSAAGHLASLMTLFEGAANAPG
jgi:glycosyltransferase involved in cell wall biosynthesis